MAKARGIRRFFGLGAVAAACSLSLALGYHLGRTQGTRTLAALGTSTEAENSEIKLLLSGNQLPLVLSAMGLKPDDPGSKQRNIYFFDTPGLHLLSAGLIYRARLKSDGDGDTTIKLLGARDGEFDPDLARRDGFKCEWDASPEAGAAGRRNCSYTHDQSALDFSRVLVAQKRSPDSLLSSRQRDFFDQAAAARLGGRQDQDGWWSSLRALGPIQSTTWKADATLELWEIPGSARILEISVRVPRTEAEQAGRQLEEWLAKNHLQPAAEQYSKTEWVLRRLSDQPRR